MAQKTLRELVALVSDIVGPEHCIFEPSQLRTYECDALTSLRVTPQLVALPRSTEEVIQLMRLATEQGLPVVPRGAGTGLSGGALPLKGSMVIGTSRMKRILEIDFDNAA